MVIPFAAERLPIHNDPHGYFRFMREALAGLFGTRMGFSVLRTDSEFPARVVSAREPGTSRGTAFLNIRLIGEKIAATPGEYIYEMDANAR
jgi:hypothetical protein